MVAYNFRDRFVPLVYSGAKTQTIRARGKKRHARPGEPLQLYRGLRTKYARKILKRDPVCHRVDEIEIRIVGNFVGVEINGVPLNGTELDAFAHADGFFGSDDFIRWWRVAIGAAEVFYGIVIHWSRP